MKIRIGYDMVYACAQPVPMILMLNTHYSRASDVVVPDHVRTDPAVPLTAYRDGFGNWCSRIVAPAGETRIFAEGVVRDSGASRRGRTQCAAARDRGSAGGDARIPARQPVLRDRPAARAKRGACSAIRRPAGRGWMRFAPSSIGTSSLDTSLRGARSRHRRPIAKGPVCAAITLTLRVTFCRCMNIPARYCTGYLPDIGVPAVPEPMDFAGWFEAFLGGRWYTFDPRNFVPRIGRVLIARGRDASDVAIATTFGPNVLKRFVVHADEVPQS